MTIKKVLEANRNIEIELLLTKTLKVSKEFLFMYPEHELSNNQVRKLSSLIKRRQNAEPMAYILGYKDFMGLRFGVNKHVLIPRPETEELINKVLQVCKVNKGKRPIKILDLGTGSGCIIISLAKLLSSQGLKIKDQRYDFYASDISKKALAVAWQNAKKLLPRTPLSPRGRGIKGEGVIRFIQSDLFKNIPGKFDIIISNLPYVPKKYYQSKLKDLAWEPKLALTDGTNHWAIFEKFFRQVSNHLTQRGCICLEIDPYSRKLLSEYQQKHLPGARTKFFKDLRNLCQYMEILA